MIRYCSTPVGRVAYSVSGAGPPLLCDSGWITHLRGQLELYSFGSFIGRLAERFTVIRYDKPGCGLSDRGGDLSFDGQLAAALAVADAVGADRFRLFGGELFTLGQGHPVVPLHLDLLPGLCDRVDTHAVAGRARYYTDAVFPDCFVCGMDRRPVPGDRLAGRP